MPNWSIILQEIAEENNLSSFDRVRRKYLKSLSEHTGRNTIAYYSGFLSKPDVQGTAISDEGKNGFMLCIHEMDRKNGLDLILHTPGGDPMATESLVQYLRDMFGRDIRAIVPQISMSAGTMLAFSCKEIWMGKHSSLGPIDPQFGAISAINLMQELARAKDEITKNPALTNFWGPILSKVTPSLIQKCEMAVNFSIGFIEKTLRENMLKDMDEKIIIEIVNNVKNVFGNVNGNAHNTHLQIQQCKDAGLVIKEIESDNLLQDYILTVHHCYMHTLSNTPANKIIENHDGKAFVKMNS